MKRASRAIDVSLSEGKGRPRSAVGLAAWLSRTAPAGARGEVSIALVGDARMRELNRRFRRENRVTDVLSFPTGGEAQHAGHAAGRPARSSGRRSPEISPPRGRTARGPRSFAPGPESALDPVFLGDIVIATGRARRQARQAGHPFSTELRVLALHGLLHLLGYDHDRDNGRMARLEKKLRRKGGLREGIIERGRK